MDLDRSIYAVAGRRCTLGLCDPAFDARSTRSLEPASSAVHGSNAGVYTPTSLSLKGQVQTAIVHNAREQLRHCPMRSKRAVT